MKQVLCYKNKLLNWFLWNILWFFFTVVFTTIFISATINIDKVQRENYVPNEETAIKIAEAIWLPIYGDEILDKKPFRATLSKDGEVWLVKGTLPRGMFGGYPIIEIRKSDCKILKVVHSK